MTDMSATNPSDHIAPATAERARRAVPYDFRRPTTLAREHARTLELAFETFARQWGTQLTARVRMMSQVTLESVSMQTYDEYVARLPATTTMVLCVVEGFAAKGVFQFPAAGALNWISHMMGSPSGLDAPERKFTRIEQTLVHSLVSESVEDLQYSLGGLLQAGMTVDTTHYNAQFAQAAAKSELVVAAAFSLRVGERTVEATLALPAECLLPQLGEATMEESAEVAEDSLRSHINGAPVEVALAFTPTAVTSRNVLSLAEGDVLRLSHPSHRPLDLTVDGRRFGAAAAGTRGGRSAAVVVSTEETIA